MPLAGKPHSGTRNGKWHPMGGDTLRPKRPFARTDVAATSGQRADGPRGGATVRLARQCGTERLTFTTFGVLRPALLLSVGPAAGLTVPNSPFHPNFSVGATGGRAASGTRR